MALLTCALLWASCAGSLWGHVHRLPLFHHAREPLIPPETFRPVPHKSPLPHGLSALLLSPARQRSRGTQPSAPGPVDVWCGLRQVSVRVDRLRLRHWSSPGLFRLSLCGVSAASPRYLYFHRGLGECGGKAQVVGGQLVYTFSLTYTAPRRGFVLRAPPLNMLLSCHYNRFHYSYRVGFQPQAPPSLFLKSVRSQTSFSLSVCNSQWEVLPPEHSFLLGEPVYFVAQAGALQAGERLYVDSCHVTGSTDAGSSARLDVIANFGCMVDSARADSSSRFHWRGSNELRFSLDSLLFNSEPQMLFLHCSMSVGLQPSPSSKSCTYDKAAGRWLELEAFPSVCSCCEGVCVDSGGADGTSVSSRAWNMAQLPHQLHHDESLRRRGPGLREELLHHDESLRRRGPGLREELLHHDESLRRRGPGLREELLHHDESLRRGPGLREELLHHDDVSLRRRPGLTGELLHHDDVSLKRRGPGLREELLHHDDVSLRRRPGLREELLHHDVSLKRGGPGLTEELLHYADVSLKRRGPGLSVELLQGQGSLRRGRPGLTEELLHHHDVSLKRGKPGLTEELLHRQGSLTREDLGLTEEQLRHDDVSLKRGGPDLTEKLLHHDDVSLKRDGPDLTEKLLHNDDVSLKRGGPGLTGELLQGQGSLRRGRPGLTEKLLHLYDVFLKRGEPGLTEELLHRQGSLTREDLGLTEEQPRHDDVSLRGGGPNLTEEPLQDDVSLKRGGQGPTEEPLHQDGVSLTRGEPRLTQEPLQDELSLKRKGPGLTQEPLQGQESPTRGDLGLTEEHLHLTEEQLHLTEEQLHLTEEQLHQDGVSLKREGPGKGLAPGLTEELLQDAVSLTRGDVDQTNELNVGEHWTQSRGDTPGNDGPAETRPPPSKTPLTYPTSAQNQSATASTTAGLSS